MRTPRKPPGPPTPFRPVSDRELLWVDPEHIEFARRCERAYVHWDLLRMIAPPSIDAEVAWRMVKFGRVQRYRQLALFGDSGAPLRYTVPDSIQQELMYVDQQLAGSLVSEDESPLSPHQKERFILSALREEAIASSMLEGAVTTWRAAKTMLQSGRKPRTRGERMVLNNYRAIQFVRENRRVNLSPALLIELQTILTDGTLDQCDQVGRFRTNDDDVRVVDDRDGSVMHTPPPASELEDRIDRLCKFANEERPGGAFVHPVIQACILHFQLGFDHPFCDGNGRTARTLFYWLMLRRGYWLFEYLPISRLIYLGPSKYVRAFLLCETDDFDVTYFLLYKAKIIERARRNLREYIHRKLHEVSQARKLSSSDKRLNHRQREIVLKAARNPELVFTIADHKNGTAIAYATARRDLFDLAHWGYLVQEQAGKRYEFRLVDQPAVASEV